MNLSLEPKEVQSWLEWAGVRLLSLQVPRAHPQGFRSYWPDYPHDKNTAYGYTNIRLRPPPPSKDDIPLIDEIFSLILLTPNIIERRVLNSRALIRPINQRYLYSWRKIALMIASDPKTAKSIHRKGLEKIAAEVARDRVGHFRIHLGLN